MSKDESFEDWLKQMAIQNPMSEEEKEAQRRSFAYGNAKIDNTNIIKEMIDSAAEIINSEEE